MQEDLAYPIQLVKEAEQALRHRMPDPQTPEIVAIFEQMKHLRESDRSLRSLRRTYQMDNMPALEPEQPAQEPVAVAGELGSVLDGYVRLQREKELLEMRVDSLTKVVTDLMTKVQTQEAQIARMSNPGS